jgi:hypothetical protein
MRLREVKSAICLQNMSIFQNWLYLSLFALLATTQTLSAQQHHHGADGGNPDKALERFGAVRMSVSCAASVQARFDRGVALLHSFWYEEAVKEFHSVIAADPKCAMAYWGLAMTEWRPFWDGMPDNRRKAGVIEIDKAAALQANTDRERRYIAALSDYLHADPTRGKNVLYKYDNALGTLHSAYPADVEAAAFYGLALAASVSTQDPVGDARRALAVLEQGFREHPDHPGFAHYIIHTCDSPQLAREGLAAAEKYASIAPSSAHALHMPSHIFARLGMWQQDIDSNRASVHASELAAQNHQSGITHEIHAVEFILYAYLQQGRDDEAKHVLDNTEPMVAYLHSVPEAANDGMAPFLSYVEVEFPAIYYLEMHDWKTVMAIPEPPNSIVSAKYFRVWAQVIAAGHLRDTAAADKAAASAQQMAAAAEKEGSPIGMEISVTQNTIKAWQSFSHKQDQAALHQISTAADMQDRTGQAEIDIPAREMYADMLLLEHQPAEALKQYRTDVQLSPNRLNGLFNAGRAAEEVGHSQEALVFYKQLMNVTNGGTYSQRSEILHARQFIQTNTPFKP